MAKSKNAPTFEEALRRIEEIVKSLDDGTAELDRSLELYEEGIGLVRLCSTMLDNAEKKIKILQSGEDGELVEKDFDNE
ncbi:MAG: exodeoxyribonuclease VII small subunit [Clostridia bacterium]|nr:exodeoxyribonuclease VII small subunit [Clostridia bacterium]